jgi:hypothetical protein
LKERIVRWPTTAFPICFFCLALKERIVRWLQEEYAKRYLMDWTSLSSSLLFSSKYAINFADSSMAVFGTCLEKKSTPQRLPGLHHGNACEDYRALWERYRNEQDVVLIVDLPLFEYQYRYLQLQRDIGSLTTIEMSSTQSEVSTSISRPKNPTC